MDLPPLAFVDVETTGVNPRENRITEIGVITVDGSRATEWTTVINPLIRRHERAGPSQARITPSRREDAKRQGCTNERPQPPTGITDEMRDAAPRFKEIAVDLARRLAGRLLIAHNARFDYEFLKAEFARTGIEFHADVLCSLMLSRRLYSQPRHHDLDSLIERHGLEAKVRHRALHDAKLIWQFWQMIHREHPEATLGTTIEALRAGPVLPRYLHPALIDRLPEAPGVYVFHGADDEILMAGTAGNLKSRVLHYFRLDLVSARALAISHRIRNITWRVTQGMLGAQLQLALLSGTSLSAARQTRSTPYSWRFAPDARPCLSLVSLADRPVSAADEWFGVFDSPRKARNAVGRIATADELCHSLLGIAEGPAPACRACAVEAGAANCGHGPARLGHLTRAYAALRDLRLPAWPYRGPIGIRERSDLHIIDHWRYRGTARNEAELHAALETRTVDFDVKIFRLLARRLPKLPRNRIVCLAAIPNSSPRPPGRCRADG